MPHDVFISYSTRDSANAERICQALETGGIRCWIAPRDITPGADWGATIVEALNEAKVMLLVFSAGANESQQVRREVQRAFERSLTVLPVRVEQVHPNSALAYYISPLHWLDAMPLDPNLGRVVDAVRKAVESPNADGADRRSAEALGYAPAPVGSSGGRWALTFALAAGAGMLLVVLGALAYRWASSALPPRGMIPFPPTTAPTTQTSPAFAPRPALVRTPEEDGGEGLRNVVADLELLDAHLAALDLVRAAPDADRAVEALSGANLDANPFRSYYNVAGTKKGNASSASSEHLRDPLQAFDAIRVDAGAVRAFADSLFEVVEARRQAPQALMMAAEWKSMTDVARLLGYQSDDDKALADWNRTWVQTVADEVVARTRLAQAAGIRLIVQGRPLCPQDALDRMAKLKRLDIPTLPTDAQSKQLIVDREAAVARMARMREKLDAEGHDLYSNRTDAWSAALQPPFKLQGKTFEQIVSAGGMAKWTTGAPTRNDSPSVLISRMRTARSEQYFDRATFLAFCYAALFRESDPGAEEYARSAAQFIVQFGRLGYHNGMYIKSVADGPAKAAGLQVGDILLSVAGKPTGDADEFGAAVKSLTPAEPVEVEYLRRDNKGLYHPRTATVPQGGSLGATVAPI